MFQTLFGELRTGRLARLPFLGYWILATVLAGFAAQAILLATGSVSGVMNTSEVTSDIFIMENMKGPLVVLLPVLGVAYLYAHLNLAAKRCRDLGLNGWRTLLWAYIIMLFAFFITGPFTIAGLQLLAFITLVVMPGNFFGSRAG